MSTPVPLPPPLQAVNTPLSAGISHDFLRRNAAELAKDIVLRIDGARNLAVLQYGLTDAQWQVLKAWPGFIEMVRAASEELAGPVGVAERARRQARLAIAEFGITDMATIMGDPNIGAQHRVKAFDSLAEIGGISGKAAVAQQAAGFGGPLIQINFPDGRSMSVGIAEQPAIEGEVSKP